jgi:hypothetical protein
MNVKVFQWWPTNRVVSENDQFDVHNFGTATEGVQGPKPVDTLAAATNQLSQLGAWDPDDWRQYGQHWGLFATVVPVQELLNTLNPLNGTTLVARAGLLATWEPGCFEVAPDMPWIVVCGPKGKMTTAGARRIKKDQAALQQAMEAYQHEYDEQYMR